MNCLDYQQWQQQHLDGEAGRDQTGVAEHLASCATCRSWHASLQQLEKGLRLDARPLPPDGLAHRIVFQVLTERRRHVRRRVLTVMALAAGLLLAIVFGPAWLRTDDPVPSPVEVAQVEPRPETPPPGPALNKSVEEAGSALVALLSRTADETVGQGRLFLPDTTVATPPMAGTDGWQHALDSPTQSLLQAGQGVSAGLEPVASSAKRAVNLFLRDLPPMTQ